MYHHHHGARSIYTYNSKKTRKNLLPVTNPLLHNTTLTHPASFSLNKISRSPSPKSPNAFIPIPKSWYPNQITSDQIRQTDQNLVRPSDAPLPFTLLLPSRPTHNLLALLHKISGLRNSKKGFPQELGL
jgi:hypothetical protein